MLGCQKAQLLSDTEIIEVHTIADEVQIPKNIMADLDAQLKQDSKTVRPVFLFMPLEVQFIEHSRNVLKAPSITFKLPKGGGKIDLKEVIVGSGSYYMRFLPEQFDALSEFKPEVLNLYYISNSPTKKIEDEVYGLGCGKMIDLKKNFSNLLKPDFLKLNTTDLRNLFVSAGRYIFVLRQSTKLFVTQLTITDSRFSKELCLGADY